LVTIYYHEHANVFESDPDRKPSLQVIENSWYGSRGINRVDVLPTHMRLRGDLARRPRESCFGQKGGWGNNVTTALAACCLATLPADKSVCHGEQAQAILQDVMHDVNSKHVHLTSRISRCDFLKCEWTQTRCVG